MKTVFFALASLALILFLYWQWHVPRSTRHPHLVAVRLAAPPLLPWSPRLARLQEARAHKAAPSVPHPVAPQAQPPRPIHPRPQSQVPARPRPQPRVQPPPRRPAVCLVIRAFDTEASARLYAEGQRLKVVRFASGFRVEKLYRVYLAASTPAQLTALQHGLTLAHIRSFYEMHRSGDPKGLSLGAYDALAGAFVRRAQLLRAGFHPHLEIEVHRSTRIRLFVTTRQPPSALPLAWHGRRLRASACP